MNCQPLLAPPPAGGGAPPAPALVFASILARLLTATRRAWQLDATAGATP